MKLAETLIFGDDEYPAGTPCELASAVETEELLRPRSVITQILVQRGHLRVIRLGDGLFIVGADAVED